MPTGYTHDIKDGISFKQFALNCARAFNACIELRDEPGGGEMIPDLFEPSDYHLKAGKQSEARLAELDAMAPEQFSEASDQDYHEQIAQHTDRIESAKQLQAKYEEMLAQVNAWTPPGRYHIEYKRFMREQIESSINFDCDISYYEKNVPMPKSPAEWRTEQTEKALKSIAYHEKEYREEVERTKARNEWIRLLRESL